MNIFDRRMVGGILWLGVLMAVISLGIGYFYWRAGAEYWQTMTFTTLTLSQLAAALAARSDNTSLLKIGILSNPSMWRALLTTFVLQLAVIYLPFFQNILETDSLPPADLAIGLGFSLLVLLIAEVVKWFERGRKRIKEYSTP